MLTTPKGGRTGISQRPVSGPLSLSRRRLGRCIYSPASIRLRLFNGYGTATAGELTFDQAPTTIAISASSPRVLSRVCACSFCWSSADIRGRPLSAASAERKRRVLGFMLAACLLPEKAEGGGPTIFPFCPAVPHNAVYVICA